MLEDLEVEDMILLIEDEGRMLYTVVQNDLKEEGLFLLSVQFINGKKIETVKNLYYNSIRTQYLYQIIKKDGVM